MAPHYGIGSPQLVPQRGAGAEGARPPLSLQVRTRQEAPLINLVCIIRPKKLVRVKVIVVMHTMV